VKKHLADIRMLLAPERRAVTMACLERKNQERNRLPMPRDPLDLEVSPRPGVSLRFGMDRFPSGSGLIFARISISNQSSTPFDYQASDFGLLMDRRLEYRYTGGQSQDSGEVGPGTQGDVRTGAHWINRGNLLTIGLIYCSSDPESEGFCRQVDRNH